MIRIGFISFAHLHAYSYAGALREMPDVEIAGVYDEDGERGRTAAEDYETSYYDNLQNLLREDIDGVIVTSANACHREHVLAAAAEGKHVLCEKPIATTIEDARDMITACREAGVILETAFPCRFHPSASKLREMIQSGELGRILAIKATNHGQMPGGWFIEKEKSGGGAVMDHTPHVVDLMRWFLETEVTRVYAESDTLLHDMEADDTGLLSLELADGTFATLDTSWSRPESFPIWGDVTMEIVGSSGVARLDMFSQNLTIYNDQEETITLEPWGSNADYLLVNNFARSIKGEIDPLISGYDGLKALEVALAAYGSIGSNMVVEVRD